MKINEGKILLMFSGILVGIFIAILIVNKSMNPTTFLSYMDYENSSMELNRLKIEVKGIKKDINALGGKLSIYNGSDNQNKTVMDTMQKELSLLQLNYGLTKVQGPGLTLTVNDRHKKKYTDEFDLLFSTVHDEDLLYLVKDLKNAGAEAISINSKRISGTSSITCEGPVIMVNNEYIVPPFVIKAIGDPDALKYALTTQTDSKYRDLEIRKIQLKLVSSPKITIDSLESVNKMKYSKVID